MAGLGAGDPRWAVAVAVAHLVTATLCIQAGGVSIVADPGQDTWDRFWQHVPLDVLRTDLARSLWHLHAQPPLYNLWGGWLAGLFFPRHLEVLHAVNVLLGSLLAGMSYLVMAQLWPRRAVPVVLGGLIALHPSLILYEAYILYSLPSAFLLTLTVFSLAWHRARGSAVALHAFLGSVTLLVLTRSLYHPFLLVPALIIVACLTGRPDRRRPLIFGALLALLAVGWCAKNYAMFGFFGTSSWFGMGWWRIAAHGYIPEQLDGLVRQGVVPAMVVQRPPFDSPSRYRPYGFTADSPVRLLERDDLHNVNIPAIARVYGASAARLIWHDAAHYGRSVYEAYLRFCRPSWRFKHVLSNGRRIAPLERAYSGPWPGPGPDGPGALAVLLPAALLLYLGQVGREVIRRRRRLADIVRQEPVMVWCFGVVLYTTLAACLFEFGEQDRFKFEVEPVLWMFIPAVLFQPVVRAFAGSAAPGSESGRGGLRPGAGGRGWRAGVWGVLLVAGLALHWLGELAPEAVGRLAAPHIRAEQGLAHVAPVPVRPGFPYRLRGAQIEWPGAGRLLLFEDGLPLGPPDAAHDTIRRSGEGAYSHWGDDLYFSSSDGSDPARNGRHYGVRARPALDPWVAALAWGLLALAAAGWIGTRGRPAARRSPTVVGVGRVMAGLGALGIVGLLAVDLVMPERSATIDPRTVTPGRGLAYLASVPPPGPVARLVILDGHEDAVGEIAVRESGRLVGRRVAAARLVETGRGGYAYGRRQLVFRSSDGSDPRTNGRTYAWSVPIRVRRAARLTLIALLPAGLALAGPWRRGAPGETRPG